MQRVALLWRGSAEDRSRPFGPRPRLARVEQALGAAGFSPVPLVYDEAWADEVGSELLACAAVLVWVNPSEDGRDRRALDALLAEVAGRGVLVSAHPATIARLGVKEVLHRTRHLPFGSDVHLYPTAADLRRELPARLAEGRPRVLKQSRGQSGDGVWKVTLLDAAGVQVQHAQRGSPVETMALADFLRRCEVYYERGGALIDQSWQERLPEGMTRCYLVRDRVEGFGHQAVNLLCPPPAGSSEPPLPGPRLYFPPDREEFQPLKARLEAGWVEQLREALGLASEDLPVLWDMDFLLGPRDASGADTYVLCEINASCVDPFPDSAFGAIAQELRRRLARRGRS